MHFQLVPFMRSSERVFVTEGEAFGLHCSGAWCVLGEFQRAPQQAHGEPGPLSAKGLIRGRKLVSHQFIDPLV